MLASAFIEAHLTPDGETRLPMNTMHAKLDHSSLPSLSDSHMQHVVTMNCINLSEGLLCLNLASIVAISIADGYCLLHYHLGLSIQPSYILAPLALSPCNSSPRGPT